MTVKDLLREMAAWQRKGYLDHSVWEYIDPLLNFTGVNFVVFFL